MKTVIEQSILSYILNSKFHLKKAGTPRSRWRQRIAYDWIPTHPGQADEFVAAWEYLVASGLI